LISRVWFVVRYDHNSASRSRTCSTTDDRPESASARLSVCLDPPSDDLQIGAVRRRATFDESSVDANDHLLGQLIGFSIFGDLLSNLFVDALSNRDHSASGGSMG
jgi:hypothetical protein